MDGHEDTVDVGAHRDVDQAKDIEYVEKGDTAQVSVDSRDEDETHLEQMAKVRLADLKDKLQAEIAKKRKVVGKQAGESKADTSQDDEMHKVSGDAANLVEKGEWYRTGAWGNVLVRAGGQGADRPPGTRRARPAMLEAVVKKRGDGLENKKETRDRENREAIGGMRNPAASVGKYQASR